MTATPEPANGKRNRMLLLITGLLLLVGLIWFCLWFFHFRYYEWTDDAYANGNLIHINSPVSGSVIAFYADDTDLVMEGQKLVQLDTTEYQALYDKELASLARVVLDVRQLYDRVHVARQTVRTQRIETQKARYDYRQRLAIVKTGAVAKEDFIHARDAYRSSIANLKQAKYALQVALDARGHTPIRKHPLIEEQKGNIRAAYYKLKHCTILAPATGYVVKRTTDVGQWVNPTTNMLAVVPKNYVWVDANYKETQVTNIRVGQPAVVTFDIYGSKVKYKGRVLGIASGTGSVFSIIPPQNATGNWIKIVQRLPVRISLDPEVLKKFPIRLGISAEVQVDITNQELPVLKRAPTMEPVATTTAYNIHLEEVDALMDQIVDASLQ
ncbi:MAG: efflux RND transporter periplasmic adaptor subunit [Verrucomicrobia bacterium]|nr:efflux RND transporter periplasmic adaptor subunit [Verrucomicrobiota bacterium]